MSTEDIGDGWMLTIVEEIHVGVMYSATLRTPWNETHQADRRFRRGRNARAWAVREKAKIVKSEQKRIGAANRSAA
jgi:hypothetical protein